MHFAKLFLLNYLSPNINVSKEGTFEYIPIAFTAAPI